MNKITPSCQLKSTHTYDICPHKANVKLRELCLSITPVGLCWFFILGVMHGVTCVVFPPFLFSKYIKHMTFKRFQHGLYTDVYRYILECRFTHFASYVVHIGISKGLYLGMEGVNVYT